MSVPITTILGSRSISSSSASLNATPSVTTSVIAARSSDRVAENAGRRGREGRPRRLLRKRDRLADAVAGRRSHPLECLVCERVCSAQRRRQALDRVTLRTPPLDLVVLAVTRHLAALVPVVAIRQRLDERRALAGARAIDGFARRA